MEVVVKMLGWMPPLLFHRLAQQAVAVGPAPVPSDHRNQRLGAT